MLGVISYIIFNYLYDSFLLISVWADVNDVAKCIKDSLLNMVLLCNNVCVETM